MQRAKIRIDLRHANPVAARRAFARKHPIRAFGNRVAKRLSVSSHSASPALSLLSESGTDPFLARKRLQKRRIRTAGIAAAGTLAGAAAGASISAIQVPQTVRVLRIKPGEKGTVTEEQRSMASRFRVVTKSNPSGVGLNMASAVVLGGTAASLASAVLAERRRRNRRR